MPNTRKVRLTCFNEPLFRKMKITFHRSEHILIPEAVPTKLRNRGVSKQQGCNTIIGVRGLLWGTLHGVVQLSLLDNFRRGALHGTQKVSSAITRICTKNADYPYQAHVAFYGATRCVPCVTCTVRRTAFSGPFLLIFGIYSVVLQYPQTIMNTAVHALGDNTPTG